MRAYIARRLLLMIPTLLGISLVCFALTQFVPGGPVEEMIAKTQALQSQKGASSGRTISAEEVENIKVYFGFDKPVWERYTNWLVNVCQFDLGRSYTYREPVWDVILKRMPISLFFGLTSFILSYLICVPLALAKARRNGGPFDMLSSLVIFTGYVIPGYALGVLLLVGFSYGEFFEWFPLGSITSDDFDNLTLLGKTLDFAHHMVLPVICYMAGEFAFLTLLLKNSLLDEISKDYMRTAMLKGASFRSALWKHALRNALIPIATRMSEIFTLMFAGALLIEKVFDIDGMGLLVYNSLIGRDYNVVLGIIWVTSVLTLFGRLFSDILYVMVDPRIQFK